MKRFLLFAFLLVFSTGMALAQYGETRGSTTNSQNGGEASNSESVNIPNNSPNQNQWMTNSMGNTYGSGVGANPDNSARTGGLSQSEALMGTLPQTGNQQESLTQRRSGGNVDRSLPPANRNEAQKQKAKPKYSPPSASQNPKHPSSNLQLPPQ